MKNPKRQESDWNAVGIIGTLLASGALALAVVAMNGAPETTPPDEAQPPPEMVSVAPEPPTPKAMEIVVEAGPLRIEGEIQPVEASAETKTPEVELAIAHEEADTDFEALAMDEMERGELEKAFTALRKHLFKGQASPSLLLTLATIGREIERYAVAERALLEAGLLDPARADIKVEEARLHLAMENPNEAAFAAKQAIRLDEEDASAWNLAGRAAMAASQWERAEQAFLHSLELDPTDAVVHNNLGLLYIYARKADMAIDELETAIELYDDQVPFFVHNNLGLAHEMVQNYEEARESFEDALLVNPYYARARVNLRRVETTLASIEKASAIETAKTIQPEATPDTTELTPEGT